MDKLAQALVRQVVLQFSATNYKVCPTRYRTRHFFNNSNTNEDIAMKFEQEYVRCVRNEEEYVCSVCVCVCVCSAPNCCDTIKLLKKCRVR